jgi:hypothetical protein
MDAVIEPPGRGFTDGRSLFGSDHFRGMRFYF